MAKQPGRRGSDRPQTLRIAACVLLVGGAVLVVAAMVSTATRLEAAGDGLLLIGVPLLLLGAGLLGLDWISSYTAAAEGSWDHHETPSASRPDPRNKLPRGATGSRTAGLRPRTRRLRLFGSSRQQSDFGPSAADTREADSRPAAPGWGREAGRAAASEPNITEAQDAAVGVAKGAAFFTAAGAVAGAAAGTGANIPARAVASAPAGTWSIAAAKVSAPPATAAAPAFAPAPTAWAGTGSRDAPEPEPEPEELPACLSRVDPGPDTVIEEFVGYEGQDRMLAVHEAELPPPRELAWPNPPRKAVDEATNGNEAFLEKLMDDVLARIGTPQERASAAPAAALGPEGAPLRARHQVASHTDTQTAPPTSAPPAAAGVAPPPATVNAAAAPALVWSRQTLHSVDHWRFAALVEKLYQQAGFATQLQAGQTMRGVVVLWLFSRHRPGMPASVVSCVHGPGDALAAEEITTVADLVKSRGLPRGQLATTAHIDAAGQQLAAQHRVHLMDTERLLQLITQRSPEQQRALADRLA